MSSRKRHQQTKLSEPIPNAGSVQHFQSKPALGEYVPAKPLQHNGQGQLVAASYMKHHSGPLPDPETLAHYEHVLPGAAERIFQRFEKQSDHRMDMEATAIRSNAFSQRFATIGSVLFSILALAATTFLVEQGKSVSGMAVFFGTVASVTATFFYGKHTQAKERQAALNQRKSSTTPVDESPRVQQKIPDSDDEASANPSSGTDTASQ